ncbi:MAG: 4-(cytidine 5'-diphospho)-2-C-methyl-D-erythritol kinase [Clostridia bacterium]|nr:4-(cytidine 5'-diphospho)-2-C-methyl-D-erythritol kinase [Clostridia bacterium]
MFVWRAYAKINLVLDVLGRLPGGYHEVSTVIQTISLADRVFIEPGGRGVTVTCSIAELSGPQNLAYRAAELFMGLTGEKLDVRIHIEKHIPVQAGLGGGSSDAACVLKALNWLTGSRFTCGTLAKEAELLGADVPFLVIGGTAWARGKGEQVTVLPPIRQFLVVVKPEFGLSTEYVYNMYDESGFPPVRPDAEQAVQAIYSGNRERLLESLGNVFEPVVAKYYPVVSYMKEDLLKLGAEKAFMTGSGPAVVGLVRSHEQAVRLAGSLREKYAFVYAGYTV